MLKPESQQGVSCDHCAAQLYSAEHYEAHLKYSCPEAERSELAAHSDYLVAQDRMEVHNHAISAGLALGFIAGAFVASVAAIFAIMFSKNLL